MAAEKTQCQGHETVGDVASIGRKQRDGEMTTGTQLDFPFFIQFIPAHDMVLPTFRVDLPTSINPHAKDMHRVLSLR